MIKRTLLLAGLLLMALSVGASAGEGSDTVGACKMLPQLRYSFSNPLWDNHHYTVNGLNRGDLDNEFEISQYDHLYYVQLNLGVTDYVDVYTMIGTLSKRLEEDAKYPIVWGAADEFRWVNNNPPGFFWGAGIKGTFYRSDAGLYIGAGASFTEARISNVTYKQIEDGVQTLDSKRSGERGAWHEYNLYADLHAGWHIKDTGLTPYVGMQYRWGWAEMKFYAATPGQWTEYYQPENPWGAYVGVDYYLNDRLSVNVQGNLVNRWGVDVGVGYRFDLCGKPEPLPPAPAPAPVIEPKLEPMSQN